MSDPIAFHIFDDLIIKLGEALKTNEAPNTRSCDGLWLRVFHGWDSTKPIERPPPIIPYKAAATMVKIGLWGEGIQAMSGWDGPLPETHQTAYVYVDIHDGTGPLGSRVRFCSIHGAEANPAAIRFSPGLNPEAATRMAGIRHDLHQRRRVTIHNFGLVVYWARVCFREYLRNGP